MTMQEDCENMEFVSPYRTNKEELESLCSQIIHQCNFVAQIIFVLPRGDGERFMKIMYENTEILLKRDLDWKMYEIGDSGIVFRIDRTNRKCKEVIS